MSWSDLAGQPDISEVRGMGRGYPSCMIRGRPDISGVDLGGPDQSYRSRGTDIHFRGTWTRYQWCPCTVQYMLLKLL